MAEEEEGEDVRASAQPRLREVTGDKLEVHPEASYPLFGNAACGYVGEASAGCEGAL
jgi:hypothetical protein